MDMSGEIQKVKAFLEKGEQCGVQIPIEVKEKLAALDRNDSLLRVVLVGGFSVGKTSIASAWLGKPREDMKISQAESPSAVTVYEVDGGVQLVDTPGLFGFKEKNISDGDAQTYRDMTRKYVSEADILLYVLDPSNPIKESHAQELHWLFRELNLLSRTVFVLSQFDKIADVEDEEDFQRHLAVKREAVIGRLDDLIGLGKEERGQLLIVAVSANPFDEGVEYWSQPENAEEFRGLSHIGDLQKTTDQMLVRSGGAEQVKKQTALSIVRDVTKRQMIPAVEQAGEVFRSAQRALRKAGQESNKLERFRREAVESRLALCRWVENYFSDLIVQLKHTASEDFEEFFYRHIGENGGRLQRNIQLHFEEELGTILHQLEAMTVAFRDSESDWAFLRNVAKGADYVQKGGFISGSTVLAARDALGVGIKFKPWGAIGLASKLNVGLAAAGPIIEGIMMWKKYNDEQNFQTQKKEIVAALEEQRKYLNDLLDSPDFMKNFFPQLAQMENAFQAIREAGEEARRAFRAIYQWAEEGRRLCQQYGIEIPALPDESQIVDI
ncbi:labile enterotoxin output A [Bombella sp. TMW2.1889]|uniref:Labile enterotoxin output A n=2 Tax=Bombella mellum TaxID=2039288 RepID=A0ABR5ZTN0_9PROT|nr:labile enterotoxin output A [Bombella mellum]